MVLVRGTLNGPGLARKPAIDHSRIAKGEQANNREIERNFPVEAVEMEDHVSLDDSVGTQKEQ